MTREEQINKLKLIAEEYINTPDDQKCIRTLELKYKTKHDTIKKYFDLWGIHIVKNHNNKNKDKQQIINKAIEEYLNTNEYIRSAAKIAKKYGLNRKTIIKYVRERGIEPKNFCNRKYFNQFIFDDIDNEHKAYWLGFLYADGYVSSKRYCTSLCLQSRDIEHLNKYCKFLDYQGQIRTVKNGLGINGNQLWRNDVLIHNKHLHETLINKGCIPNKSIYLKFPNLNIFKDLELVNHFIRGYIDGDGCIGHYINKDGSINNSITLIGNYDFLKGVQEFYKNIKSTLRHKDNKASYVYTLTFNSNNAIKLGDIIYSNSTVYLERKYNNYLKMKFPLSEKLGSNKICEFGRDIDISTE